MAGGIGHRIRRDALKLTQISELSKCIYVHLLHIYYTLSRYGCMYYVHCALACAVKNR